MGSNVCLMVAASSRVRLAKQNQEAISQAVNETWHTLVSPTPLTPFSRTERHDAHLDTDQRPIMQRLAPQLRLSWSKHVHHDFRQSMRDESGPISNPPGSEVDVYVANFVLPTAV